MMPRRNPPVDTGCPAKWGTCKVSKGQHECNGSRGHGGVHVCAWCGQPK